MTVYLDACAIVYVHEGTSEVRDSVAAWLKKASGDGAVMTSALSRLECRVKPMREHNGSVPALYDQFFLRQSLRILPLSDAVLDKATELRAGLGIKTPDALHLASAIIARAEVFVTGDAALQRCKEVRVEMVP